jgi:hypothetical protein
MFHASLDRKAMSVLHKTEMLETVCKESRRWGMYIGIHIPDGIPDPDGFAEVLKAASFLDFDLDSQVIADEEGWILFDSQEEMERAFELCVGDDGPTSLNSYNGPVRIFALTCSNKGELLNENT